MPRKNHSSIDIFDMLSNSGKQSIEKTESPQKTQRRELLETTKCKDLFPEGKITINKVTCVGVQCRLCIKACPTNALYWTSGGIGITEDLCLHCEACVLSCMVDDCIKIVRKREDGKEEKFSRCTDIVVANDQLNAKKRFQRVHDVLPSVEDYCRKYSLEK